MYKVFVYDKPVFITSSDDFKVKNCQQFKGVDVNKIIDSLENEYSEGAVVCVKDEKKAWKEFKNYFKYIKAAGGVVQNTNDDVLVIYRLGKWDLPKGKMEKGEDVQECALREIEEECGIDGLEIVNELPSTYHCYPLKNKWVLKRTYWFKVKSSFVGTAIPQAEEGIEEVLWKRPDDLDDLKKNTYKSILEVLNNWEK